MASNFAVDLGLAHPEDRAVEVDVLATGEIGVEAGADLDQPGDPTAGPAPFPSSGSMTPEISFSSVLLPEPLSPISPMLSPSSRREGHVARAR